MPVNRTPDSYKKWSLNQLCCHQAKPYYATKMAVMKGCVRLH